MVTRRFALHSNTRDAGEIKRLPISMDICNRNMELLLLFSILSPCFNVIRSCFGKLCEPLRYRFNLSFEKSFFSDDLKIAKVFKVFKHQYLKLITIQNLVTNICATLFLQNTWMCYVQSLIQTLTWFKHCL